MTRQILLPEGWPSPRGFSHGVVASGRVVLLGGQIGWNAQGEFAEGLVAQTRQALANIVAVLRECGGRAEHVARLTWFVTDIDAYRQNLRPLGAAYREVMGANYPAMSLVAVTALVEPAACVEIEATAVLPVP